MPARPGTVLLAAPRGFCAGVDRAVVIVELALRRYGAPVYVRRQIVHNSGVVSRLEALGAVFVAEIDEIPAGNVVVFSAHGVSPAVRDQAAARRLRIVDATCPLVTKVHREAQRLTQDGYTVLLIGSPGHDEVVGVQGEHPEKIHVVPDETAVTPEMIEDPGRVAWLSQTTLAVDDAMAVAAGLRHRLPMIVGPPSDDICYAAQNRQSAVRLISRRAQLVLVVGSANSHNSSQLVEVALASGAAGAHLIDGGAKLDVSWLRGVETVGVAAGASAPSEAIESVLARLAELGYPNVREVTAAREQQTFALPRNW